jgi:hypothetical protein
MAFKILRNCLIDRHAMSFSLGDHVSVETLTRDILDLKADNPEDILLLRTAGGRLYKFVS